MAASFTPPITASPDATRKQHSTHRMQAEHVAFGVEGQCDVAVVADRHLGLVQLAACRFDPAGYLNDIDDVAGYLQLALPESADDPTAVPRTLGVIARSGKHE